MSIKFHQTKQVGYIATEGGSKFKTTDNGETWFYPDSEQYERTNGDDWVYTRIDSEDLAIDSLGNFIAVGTNGIWMTTNLGERWIRIDSGMQHVNFNRVEVSPSGYIYVAAEYGGVYRSKQRFASVKNSIQSTKLHLETLPNPVFSEAEITYTIHTAGRTKLILYNLLGISVSTLSDTHHEAGRHTARLSAANLPADAYFLRLESGGESVAKAVWVAR